MKLLLLNCSVLCTHLSFIVGWYPRILGCILHRMIKTVVHCVHTGWYDYAEEASDVVEQLHHEWTFNTSLCTRFVQSGVWEYLVDLSRMIQTNQKHPAHKQRHIRRWTRALGDDQTPPGDLAATASQSTGSQPTTPTATASGAPFCLCSVQQDTLRHRGAFPMHPRLWSIARAAGR